VKDLRCSLAGRSVCSDAQSLLHLHMRYKYSLIPALLIGFLLICSFKAAETFSRSGISFNIPNDWTITELEKLDEESYYLSCEKSGSNASGL